MENEDAPDEVKNQDGSYSLEELVDFQGEILKEDGMKVDMREFLRSETEASKRTRDIDSLRLLGAPDAMTMINPDHARGEN